jgi:hypothetical protein
LNYLFKVCGPVRDVFGGNKDIGLVEPTANANPDDGVVLKLVIPLEEVNDYVKDGGLVLNRTDSSKIADGVSLTIDSPQIKDIGVLLGSLKDTTETVGLELSDMSDIGRYSGIVLCECRFFFHIYIILMFFLIFVSHFLI